MRAALLAAALLLVAGCGDDDETLTLTPLDLQAPVPDLADLAPPANDDAGPQATISVGAGGGNRFNPQTLFVAAGTRVTWRWISGVHGVVSDDTPAAFAPSATQAAGSYAVTFGEAGQFGYHCSVHGSMMSGVVIVE